MSIRDMSIAARDRLLKKQGSPTGGARPASDRYMGAAAPATTNATSVVPMPSSGAPAGMSREQAAQIVQGQLAPEVNAIQRALQQAEADYTHNYNTTAQRGQRQQEDLASLYNRLGTFQGERQGAQDQVYYNTHKTLDANYGQLQQMLQGAFGRGAEGTNSELDRLGLGGVRKQAISPMASDFEFLRGLTATDRANSLGNNQSARANFGGLMSLMRSNSQAEGTGAMKNARTQMEELLAELTRSHQSGSNELRGQLADVQGSAGSRIQELMAQMQQQGPSEYDMLQTAKLKMELERMMAEDELKARAGQMPKGKATVANPWGALFNNAHLW